MSLQQILIHWLSTKKQKLSFDCCWCLVSKSCLSLCNHMDCSPLGSPVHGISQARILEWVSVSFSRGSSWPRDRTWVSCTGGRVLYDWASEGEKDLKRKTASWKQREKTNQQTTTTKHTITTEFICTVWLKIAAVWVGLWVKETRCSFTLEQHRFKLHSSTYTSDFFDTCKLQH